VIRQVLVQDALQGESLSFDLEVLGPKGRMNLHPEPANEVAEPHSATSGELICWASILCPNRVRKNELAL
jgi:hypothetical protein